MVYQWAVFGAQFQEWLCFTHEDCDQLFFLEIVHKLHHLKRSFSKNLSSKKNFDNMIYLMLLTLNIPGSTEFSFNFCLILPSVWGRKSWSIFNLKRHKQNHFIGYLLWSNWELMIGRKKDKLLEITVNFLGMLFYCCHTLDIPCTLKKLNRNCKKGQTQPKSSQKGQKSWKKFKE